MSALFLLVIGLIFAFGVGKIDFANYTVFSPAYWFFPYGVLIFAFSGLAGLPIQRRMLTDNEKYLKKSILAAVVFVGILYFIFSFTVLGISGESTTPDGINGLIEYITGPVIFLGSLFGILAVTTSFIMLGYSLLQVFTLDYGFNKAVAWLLVVLPPIILFFGGLRNFIDVISLSGAVAGGLEAIVLIFVFIKTKTHGDRIPEYSLSVPAWALYLLAMVFLGGVGYSLITR